VKLREDLYTLAQMRVNHLMQFFDVRSRDGQWWDIDLNAAGPLFSIYVAENRMKPILEAFVTTPSVKPDKRPVPRIMLSAAPIVGSKYKYSVDLIELDDACVCWDVGAIKRDLAPATDADNLRRYELTGMWGDPDELAKRLTRYFDTGVDWHEQKSSSSAAMFCHPSNDNGPGRKRGR
jgi:hypothetical protein